MNIHILRHVSNPCGNILVSSVVLTIPVDLACHEHLNVGLSPADGIVQGILIEHLNGCEEGILNGNWYNEDIIAGSITELHFKG